MVKPRICFRKNLLGESNIAVVAHGSERPYLRMDTSSVSEGKKCRTEIHRVKFSNISSIEKKTNPALPCWPSGKESTCQCRRHGFDPWSGKIPHASATKCESGNYWARLPHQLKPVCPRARAPQQEKSLQWETHARQLQSSPHSLQLEKSPCSRENPK